MDNNSVIDFMDQECRPGDFFVYAVTHGSSAVLGLYKLLEIKHNGSVKAQLVSGNDFNWKSRVYDPSTNQYISTKPRASFLFQFHLKAVKVNFVEPNENE